MIPLLIVVAVIALCIAFNFGVFHSQIEAQVTKKTGMQVKLGAMTLIPKWPLVLRVQESRVENELLLLEFGALNLEIASLTSPFAVSVGLVNPRFEMKGEAKPSAKAPPASSPGGGEGSMTPVHLKFTIDNGTVVLKDLTMRGLELNFEQKVLLHSPAKLHLKAFVEYAAFPLKLPITVDTDDLTVSKDSVKATDLKVGFAGLQADAQGTSLLNEDRHRWKAVVQANDLTKLPKPTMEMPATDIKGAVRLNIEVGKEGPEKWWRAEGEVVATNVSGNLRVRQDKLVINGLGELNLQGKFLYDNMKAALPNLKGSLDLSRANVSYQDILQKSPGQELKLSVDAGGDIQRLTINSFGARLWKFDAKVSGYTTPRAPYTGKLNFELLPVVLAGAEKVLLPLGSIPVSGEVACKGSLEGLLTDPRAAHLLIENFKVKDFSASLNYDKPGVFKVMGPVSLSIEGHAEIDKSEFKNVAVKGRLQAPEAALVAGPLRKEAKQNLVVDFFARNAGTTLDIDWLNIDSFAGKIKLSGKVSNPAQPTMQNLKLDFQPLQLGELRMALPDFRESIPKGTLNGNLRLNGKVASDKPWAMWSVDVDGALRLLLPEYVLSAPPPEDKTKLPQSTKPTPAASTSFLPGGYLTSHLKVKVLADVETFKKDALVVKGIHADGNVAGGHFRGMVAVKQIFSGEATMTQLDIPLLDQRPTLQGALKFSELVTEDAIGFAKPEYKDFATGKMAGSVDFATYMPSDPEFLPFLKAKGDLLLQPVTLNSVKVGQMINDMLKQLPMVKSDPVKTDPLKGSAKMYYDIRNQALMLESLDAKDVDNSELQLKGKVALNTFQGDLVGTFLWAKPTIKGCLLQGNSDAQGRMLIPVAIKGDLMHPGFSTLSDLVAKLAPKALECEKNKLVDSIQKDGGKQLEDEVKKKLKGLFGN